MSCPISRDTSRYLSDLDRDTAAEEREGPEVRPCLECGKEQDNGVWCGAGCFMKWDARKKGYSK